MQELLEKWQDLAEQAMHSENKLLEVERQLSKELGFEEDSIKYFKCYYEEKIKFCLSKHMSKEEIIKKILRKNHGGEESDD